VCVSGFKCSSGSSRSMSCSICTTEAVTLPLVCQSS
jgi:hypothetical protein